MRIFIDASVIIAGLYSPDGGSGLIIDLIENGKIEGYVSQSVLGESMRNIESKMPNHVLVKFEKFSQCKSLRILPAPDVAEVKKWYEIIDPKDAHVLASCLVSKSKYLITLDRQHFMLESVKLAVPFGILTPKEFIQNVLLAKR